MVPLINQKKLGELLNVSRGMLGKLRKAGMPYMKIGSSIRYFPEDVLDWLKKQKNAAESSEIKGGTV